MDDLKVGAEDIREVAPRVDRGEAIGARWQLSALQTGIALLGAAAGLFLIWQMSSSLLLIFAGVLFAAFLDACARALEPIIPVGHSWRLTLIVLILTGLLGLGLIWGAGKLPEQTRLLYQVMNAQLDVLQQRLQSGRRRSVRAGRRPRFLAMAAGPRQTVRSRADSGWHGIRLPRQRAYHPVSRRAVRLQPRDISRRARHVCEDPYRARVRQVMDEMGAVLRYWFVGQVFRILLMTLCVWLMLYLLGVPGAFLLGLQAGVSNFVPYLGPIVAAFPIGLVAMPLGPSKLMWAVGLYTIIQSIEGYIIGPLIQRHAVEVPPAWTLVAIVLFGSLFGVMGIALAMPLLAIGRIAVLRLYVEDCLGDKPS